MIGALDRMDQRKHGARKLLWPTIFVFLVSVQAASAQDKPFEVPGTGITIVLPPGLALGHVGAFLFDGTGETSISFASLEEKQNPDADPVWRSIFPRKAGSVGHLPKGKLRRRSRAADGGEWEGLMLTSVREGRALQVILNYKGNSPETFESLRKSLLTVTWDPGAAQTELAMGVDFDFEGLKPVAGEIALLMYTSTGLASGEGMRVDVLPMPMTAARENATFPAHCEAVLAGGLLGAAHSPVVMKTLPTHSYCELWTDPIAAEGKYMAMVRLKAGGLMTLWGTAPPAEFAAALPLFRRGVESMRVLRGP